MHCCRTDLRAMTKHANGQTMDLPQTDRWMPSNCTSWERWKKLIVTGDGASNKNGNVEVYLNQLERVWGVNREDVLIEPKALSTFQNIDYSLKLVPDMRSENTIVVNSAIYMRRTLLSCEKRDLHPAYYATDVNMTKRWTWQSWIPDFHVMDE